MLFTSALRRPAGGEHLCLWPLLAVEQQPASGHHLGGERKLLQEGAELALAPPTAAAGARGTPSTYGHPGWPPRPPSFTRS